MAMQYINYIKSRAPFGLASKFESPVLSEDDEAFLNRITSEENPPALPPRQARSDLGNEGSSSLNDAQTALMDGAQNVSLEGARLGLWLRVCLEEHGHSCSQRILTINLQIPLPNTPQTELTEEPLSDRSLTDSAAKPRTTWSWLRRDSRDAKRETTAEGLADIAQGLKDADAKPNEDHVVPDEEAKKEEEDMAEVLDSLNLAAVNNRVFSISDETQELLQKFNEIVKDLINGVPTAYDDLEKLLTLGDDQLTKTFNSLPSFLQKLIAKLPERMTAGLGPGVMAAASEKASHSGVNLENAGKAAAAAKKMGFKVPSLKDITGKPAAIASLLRSIIMYLRTRFPAFLGMNVLWSLAMFGKCSCVILFQMAVTY